MTEFTKICRYIYLSTYKDLIKFMELFGDN
jgi:hypothetical protein